jgi:hypothetical protein
MSGEWRVKSEEWKKALFYSLHSSLFTLHLKIRKSYTYASTKLKFTPKILISLIIKLTKVVDKAVDKLWISCGQSCG